MALEEDNQQFLRSTMTFFESFLTRIQRKQQITKTRFLAQWESLGNNDESIYALQIKRTFQIDDLTFFAMLLAFTTNLSTSVQSLLEQMYGVRIANLQLALSLYQELYSIHMRDAILPIYEENWEVLFTTTYEEEDYVHTCKLLLQPWMLTYMIHGDRLSCPFISRVRIKELRFLNEDDNSSFLRFCYQGMKAISSKADEEALLEVLHGFQIPIYRIQLAKLPDAWKEKKLLLYTMFMSRMLPCAFFIQYHDATQRSLWFPNLLDLPLTFLIASENLLMNELGILRMPYTKKQEHQVLENPFVKINAWQSPQSSFLANPSLLQRLAEFEYMVEHRHVIYSYYNCHSRQGISALFYGPSGCGKTLAAQHIAKHLQKDLWQVNMSNVLDKYIGESEKHLEKIFHEAQLQDVILLFDEADILFSKRTAIHDANDRYANALTAYLLQRMENFPGVMILTSNFLHNFDDAFLRRITSILRFQEADEDKRLEKWQTAFTHVKQANPMDWDEIAKVKLSFARIDQCTFLAISFMMAEKCDGIHMKHIKKAICYELEKHGELPPAPWRKEVSDSHSPIEEQD